MSPDKSINRSTMKRRNQFLQSKYRSPVWSQRLGTNVTQQTHKQDKLLLSRRRCDAQRRPAWTGKALLVFFHWEFCGRTNHCPVHLWLRPSAPMAGEGPRRLVCIPNSRLIREDDVTIIVSLGCLRNVERLLWNYWSIMATVLAVLTKHWLQLL